jgi:hypothetical protein
VASNSGAFSASHTLVLCSQPPVQNSTEIIGPTALDMSPWHGPHRKRPVSNSNSIIVVRVLVATGTCLPSRCREPFAVYRVTALHLINKSQ